MMEAFMSWCCFALLMTPSRHGGFNAGTSRQNTALSFHVSKTNEIKQLLFHMSQSLNLGPRVNLFSSSIIRRILSTSYHEHTGLEVMIYIYTHSFISPSTYSSIHAYIYLPFSVSQTNSTEKDISSKLHSCSVDIEISLLVELITIFTKARHRHYSGSVKSNPYLQTLLLYDLIA